MSLADLLEAEDIDDELIPDIISVDAKLGFTCSVARLQSVLERANAVTPAKEIILGTGYALFETVAETDSTEAHLYITATDGEQTVKLMLAGIVVTTEGSALVPGKRILEILKAAPTDKIRIEVIGNSATLRSSNAVWTIQTPVADYQPPLPDTSSIALQAIVGDRLLKGLLSTMKAISTTAARVPLMQAHVQDGYVRACDSARLHQQMVPGIEGLEFDIPLKVVIELIKTLKAKRPPKIEIGASNHFLIFKIDGDLIVAQRLLIPFPDTDALLLGPRLTNDNVLTFDRKALLEAVKRVRISADPDIAAVYLTLTPTKTTWLLAVRARDRAGNKAQELIEVQWEGDKPIELVVNHRFLMELLGSYTEEFVNLKLGENSKTKKTPLLIDDKTTGFSAVVQQMKPFS